MLHNQFHTSDKIDKVGFNNFIINFISYYNFIGLSNPFIQHNSNFRNINLIR